MKTEKFQISDNAAVTTVIVEPWGLPYTIPPGSRFEVVLQGPDDGKMEIEKRPSEFIVYGWPGSSYSASMDGSVLRSDSPAVPAVPSGTSVKNFLRVFSQEQ